MILGGLPEVQFITRTCEQVYRESIVVLKSTSKTTRSKR